jgi:hypothetical protein
MRPWTTVKKWPETRLNAPFTDTTFRLQTVWRNGNIYYQFGIEGYPPVFRQASGRESQSAFQINFLDKDGFQLYQRQVTLAEMTKVVGDDDQPTGELWKSNEAMDVDLYRRAAKWEITWSGFSPAPSSLNDFTPLPSAPVRKPASPPTPKWKNKSAWRSLSHGMPKDDVKRLLGEPGKIVDLGAGFIWYYGYPLGGEASFGSDGRLESWSEP